MLIDNAEMIVEYGKVAYLTKEAQEYVLKADRMPKYIALFHFLLDTGARCTEARLLTWNDFNFQSNIVNLVTLKQGEKAELTERETKRVIPLTQRLIRVLSEWYRKSKYKKGEDYVFHGMDGGMLSRNAIWKRCKRIHPQLHPHIFRHTFATEKVGAGVDLLVIQSLLGHKKQETTLIYAHIPIELARSAVETNRGKGIVARLWESTFGREDKIYILPVKRGLTDFHVGRLPEISRIADYKQKDINTLILGGKDIGKTHLIDNLEIEKSLYLHEIGTAKSTAKALIENLVENYDRGDRLAMFLEGADANRWAMKANTAAILEMLINIVEPYEFSIIIDDVTKLSAGGAKFLEKISKHFHVICGAREVRERSSTTFSNFSIIRLEPLKRTESVVLIDELTKSWKHRIHDYEQFKNHVINQTNNVPGYIQTICRRFEAEPEVTEELVPSVKHTAATKPIDMSMPFLLVFMLFALLRYYGREAGGDDKGALTMIGSMVGIMLIFARYFLFAAKKKTL